MPPKYIFTRDDKLDVICFLFVLLPLQAKRDANSSEHTRVNEGQMAYTNSHGVSVAATSSNAVFASPCFGTPVTCTM